MQVLSRMWEWLLIWMRNCTKLTTTGTELHGWTSHSFHSRVSHEVPLAFPEWVGRHLGRQHIGECITPRECVPLFPILSAIHLRCLLCFPSQIILVCAQTAAPFQLLLPSSSLLHRCCVVVSLQEKKRSRWEGADRRLVERIFFSSFLVLEWYYYLAILVQKAFWKPNENAQRSLLLLRELWWVERRALSNVELGALRSSL